MKVVEKMQLIENIAVTLQEKYTFSDIDIFLSEFKVSGANPDDFNSKRIYVKERLKGISQKELKRIADELDISTDNILLEPPKNWEGESYAKAFISHTVANKKIAKRLRDALEAYNIRSFVAHEDIKPSEEWQIEIERALKTMDFFISLHTKGFSESIWCQQEVGFAACRGVKIVPIKFDEDPVGFIGKIQALIRDKKKAEQVAEDILGILKVSPKTADLYKEKIAPSIADYDEIPF